MESLNHTLSISDIDTPPSDYTDTGDGSLKCKKSFIGEEKFVHCYCNDDNCNQVNMPSILQIGERHGTQLVDGKKWVPIKKKGTINHVCGKCECVRQFKKTRKN